MRYSRLTAMDTRVPMTRTATMKTSSSMGEVATASGSNTGHLAPREASTLTS